MPLNEKGKKIMRSMKKPKSQGGYGSTKKAEKVFYASENKGTIKNITRAKPAGRV